MSDDKKSDIHRKVERKIELDNKDLGRRAPVQDRASEIQKREQKTTSWNDTPPPPKKTKPKE